MNTTYKLVEIAKEKTGIESDYGIANLLGVSKGMVSHWKVGRSEANGVNLLRLIKEAGLSIDDALKIMSKEAQTVSATASTANDNCILCKIVKFKIKAQLLRFAFKCRMQAICVHLLQTN